LPSTYDGHLLANFVPLHDKLITNAQQLSISCQNITNQWAKKKKKSANKAFPLLSCWWKSSFPAKNVVCQTLTVKSAINNYELRSH